MKLRRLYLVWTPGRHRRGDPECWLYRGYSRPRERGISCPMCMPRGFECDQCGLRYSTRTYAIICCRQRPVTPPGWDAQMPPGRIYP